MTETKYGKYIVTNLQAPFDEEYNRRYAEWAKRVLWMDKKVVDGAFQMNVSWYLKAQTGDQTLPEHRHDEDEILGFFGSDHNHPYELGGEVELWLEDEMHIITQSALVFIPGGMKHCPLVLRRVDNPIFHFSTVTGGSWDLK